VIFYFEIEGSHPSEEAEQNTHTIQKSTRNKIQGRPQKNRRTGANFFLGASAWEIFQFFFHKNNAFLGIFQLKIQVRIVL